MWRRVVATASRASGDTRTGASCLAGGDIVEADRSGADEGLMHADESDPRVEGAQRLREGVSRIRDARRVGARRAAARVTMRGMAAIRAPGAST